MPRTTWKQNVKLAVKSEVFTETKTICEIINRYFIVISRRCKLISIFFIKKNIDRATKIDFCLLN